jgi:beta-glucosidase
MPISDELIKKSAENSDCAIVVIGRSAGEDRENYLTKGSYYLTDDESSLIKRVSENFKNTVVVMNIGSIMDMYWENELLSNNCAIMIPYQGGMESGNAIADVIFGDEEPSGRLTDTISNYYQNHLCAEYFGDKEYNNYFEDIYVGYRYFETFSKENVLYPFGYGLGYTTFETETTDVQNDLETITVEINTKNTGKLSGKNVLQVYVESPQGKLGKPARVLCGFQKTKKLAPSVKTEKGPRSFGGATLIDNRWF